MSTPADGGQQPEPGGAAPAPPIAPARPARRRGVMITSIVLGVVLLLCGGGALATFLVLRQVEAGEGAAEPTVAVDDFLSAVYANSEEAGGSEQAAAEVAKLVCPDSRDQADIKKKIEEVRGYADTYANPRFDWPEPQVSNQSKESATVTAKVTVSTEDEKSAEQQLTFTVVEENGWWVCEVTG